MLKTYSICGENGAVMEITLQRDMIFGDRGAFLKAERYPRLEAIDSVGDRPFTAWTGS